MRKIRNQIGGAHRDMAIAIVDQFGNGRHQSGLILSAGGVDREHKPLLLDAQPITCRRQADEFAVADSTKDPYERRNARDQ